MEEITKTKEILILLSKAKVGSVVGGKQILAVSDKIHKLDSAITCKETFRTLLPGRYKMCKIR